MHLHQLMSFDEKHIPEEFKKLAKDFSDDGFITTSFENFKQSFMTLSITFPSLNAGMHTSIDIIALVSKN